MVFKQAVRPSEAKGGSYGEEERTAARPSGRDYQGRYPAVGRAVRDGCGQSFGCVSPDASRHSGGAQTLVCRHVPEGGPPVWRLAGSMDAIASRLRPEKV